MHETSGPREVATIVLEDAVAEGRVVVTDQPRVNAGAAPVAVAAVSVHLAVAMVGVAGRACAVATCVPPCWSPCSTDPPMGTS